MPPRADASPPLPLRTAVALGALQGPAELLPISSSAHLTLVPWLAGSAYGTLDADLRKAFEVAVHGGTGLALGIVWREDLGSALERLGTPRGAAFLAASAAVPAVVGLALERPIEERLGGPLGTAAGLAAGALALLATARATGRRSAAQAGVGDGLWLGAAQACALVPGVSRSGATLAVARRRGFDAPAAAALSREVALPVIAGASALKARRLAQRGIDRATAAPVLVGAGAAFASTLAARRLSGVLEREGAIRALAGYRMGLAALVSARAIMWRG
jgi:undecaprenyl-diphosphatase